VNISNNLSSIQAHQSILDTSAKNIANVNTDTYIPSDTRISNANGSPVAKSELSTDTGSLKSQTDLTHEIPKQIIAQEGVALNVATIRTEDEMLGSLLDIKV